MNTKKTIGIVICLLALIAVLGFASQPKEASEIQASAQPAVQIEPETNDNQKVLLYPTNDRGQTYGSLAEAELEGELPDLISVMFVSGEYGYVYREDWEAYSRQNITKGKGEELNEEDHDLCVIAFCEFYREVTGQGANYQAFDTVLFEIERSTGSNAPWVALTERQQIAVMELFPTEYQSREIAKQAYDTAMIGKIVLVPVYALDGETVIGDISLYNRYSDGETFYGDIRRFD